uniref:Gustatory receptor n=1 Tax=Diabrotica virgifera virgifera TaxID=50390 RepID=A0A6P7GIQ0_DIAVI
MFEICRVLKSDIQIFKFIIKIGKYWGPFPIKGNIVAKICYFVTALVFSIISVMSLVFEFKRSTSFLNLGVADIFIFFCNWTTVFIHHLYCTYYGKYFNRNSWNRFFHNMSTLDKFSTDRNLALYLIKIICFLAIFFCSSGAIMKTGGFLDLTHWYSKLAYVFWTLSSSQLFYLVVFWWETCNILSSRYAYINNARKKIVSEDTVEQQKSIKEITSVIVTLHKTVKCMNKTAGFFILALLGMSFLALLSCFNLFLVIWKYDDTLIFQILWCFLSCISCIVFSIIVIMSCEKVEKKAAEFIQTCVYIHATTGDEHAATLVNLAKELRPKFSAAGFFDINQRLLPIFFSNLSTYLIIILQFKISSL